MGNHKAIKLYIFNVFSQPTFFLDFFFIYGTVKMFIPKQGQPSNGKIPIYYVAFENVFMKRVACLLKRSVKSMLIYFFHLGLSSILVLQFTVTVLRLMYLNSIGI